MAVGAGFGLGVNVGWARWIGVGDSTVGVAWRKEWAWAPI